MKMKYLIIISLVVAMLFLVACKPGEKTDAPKEDSALAGEAYKRPSKEAPSLEKKLPVQEPIKPKGSSLLPPCAKGTNEVVMRDGIAHLCVAKKDYVGNYLGVEDYACTAKKGVAVDKFNKTIWPTVDLAPKMFLNAKSYLCGDDPWGTQKGLIWIGCATLAPATEGIKGWTWSTPAKNHKVKAPDGCMYVCQMDKFGINASWTAVSCSS